MSRFLGHERRVHSDVWLKTIQILTLVAWAVFIVALIVSYYAAPDNEFGVLRYHGISVRKFWLTPLTGYLYILLWISALLSYIALIIHKFRSRRKSDNTRFNIFLLFIVSIAWTVYIVFQLSR
ncbi:hypothetical protein Q4489_17155 [Thalassotalea sp. 1_MG-2023]|uniref:hypothetical protein n=1 Tax=Thalassotalea sp. 1_MG-2023 TaxID=3062680 RepID=UPI0026E394DB|nr:hypothetical protein [Thalassotalea sp. 1_MG-2023]MDO6428739.1 hypothetical protein [Thalassotalea sp. 1_MG-2023]